MRTTHMNAYQNSRNRCRVTLKDFGNLSFDVARGAVTPSQTTNLNQTSLVPRKHESPLKDTAPARVIVADDTPSVRESLVKLLRSEGYEVEAAANGLEVLEKFDPARTDLLLLDLEMPVTNGWDALERIFQIKPQQAVIIITGQREPARWSSVPRPGILIEKPIDVALLLDSIRQALSESPSIREERITIQRSLTRHTRPLPYHLRLSCYPRGGINE